MDLCTLYKCLSDPTRLRIVNLPLKDPWCVCDIQDCLKESQVKTSKHIGYMKKQGLVTVERKANWNFYEIVTELPKPVSASLKAIENHGSEEPQLKEDLKRLRESEATACG